MKMRDFINERKLELSDMRNGIQTAYDAEQEALKKKYKADLKELEAEEAMIEAALNIDPGLLKATESPKRPRLKMTINKAVIAAVSVGHAKPMGVFKYITEDLNVDTTINSVRVRLSRLGGDGEIGRSDKGWVPIEQAD